MKRNSNEQGFTLVEVMIVVIILAILAGIAMFSFGGFDVRAKNARAQADINTIATALKGYKALTGAWPAALADLTTTAGTYTALIDSIPDDPWANPVATYVYTSPSATNPDGVDVTSAGPDGIAGGANAADDITRVIQ
jgi:prepilin-type N-terminal cleavage/methylation domain